MHPTPWSWLKQTDLIPDRGQFRSRFHHPLSYCCPATIFRDPLSGITDEHEAADRIGSRVKMAKAELTAEQRDHLEQHVAGIGHNQGPALLEHTEEIIEPARHHRLKAELTGIHRRRLFNRLQGLWIRSSA